MIRSKIDILVYKLNMIEEKSSPLPLPPAMSQQNYSFTHTDQTPVEQTWHM
jgi:hypothetical protein